MADTLLLDTQTWDLVLDIFGNMAIAKSPYAVAQDAASAIRTFQGEVYYDVDVGVPYWQQILGHWPSAALMKSAFNQAALTVPNCVSSTCYLAAVTDREVTGQVQVTDSNQEVSVAVFKVPQIPTAQPANIQQDFFTLGGVIL